MLSLRNLLETQLIAGPTLICSRFRSVSPFCIHHLARSKSHRFSSMASADKLAELYEHYNKLDTAKEDINQVCWFLLFWDATFDFYSFLTNLTNSVSVWILVFSHSIGCSWKRTGEAALLAIHLKVFCTLSDPLWCGHWCSPRSMWRWWCKC